MWGIELAKPVKIGALRHRITIQSLLLAPDGQGGNTEVWTDLCEIWADVQPVSSNERLYARQLQYTRSHKVIIRNLEDLDVGVTHTHRFLFDQRTFHIKGIRRLDEKRFWLILDAEENVAT